MANWRKSDYPFKSPHWRKYTGEIFYELCQEVGDPAKIPLRVPRGKNKFDYKDQPKFKALSERAVLMMENFFKLDSYTNLTLLEKTIPLRYLYILPARHGIVIYSVYAHLVSKDPNIIASKAEMQKYIGFPYDGDGFSSKQNYFIFNLIQTHFSLFTISKPFRCLLLLPVIITPKKDCTDGKGKILKENLDKMKERSKKVLQFIEPRKEWESVSSPGNIIHTIYQILLKFGSRIALQYVRYIFRIESLMRQMLIAEINFDPEKCAKKILGLTERYLNIDEVIKAVERIDA